MKYNLEFEHITGLLQQMSEDAAKSLTPENCEKPIGEDCQLGLQLAKLMWSDPKFVTWCRNVVLNMLVTPQEGLPAMLELGYRMALSDIERAREVKELESMFSTPQEPKNG